MSFTRPVIDVCVACVCVCVQTTPMAFMCCATFIVTRERVLARPREMYQDMYAFAEKSVRVTWLCVRVCGITMELWMFG